MKIRYLKRSEEVRVSTIESGALFTTACHTLWLKARDLNGVSFAVRMSDGFITQFAADTVVTKANGTLVEEVA